MLAASGANVNIGLSPHPWPGIMKMRFEQLRSVCRAEGISDEGSHTEVRQRLKALIQQKYSHDRETTTRTGPENGTSADAIVRSDSSSTCSVFLKKKNRRCCNPTVKGRSTLYCRFHIDLEAGCSRVKVACPLDPSHSVWEDRLEEHLKVCETARRKAALKERLLEESLQQPFYAYEINSSWDEHDKEDSKAAGSDARPTLEYGPEALAWLRAARSSKDRLLGSVLPFVSLSGADHSSEIFINPTESIHSAPDNESPHLSDDDCNETPETTGTRSELALKHRLQEQAVVAHLREIDLLRSDITYLEFGAGSGGLGWAVREAAAPGKPAVVLIEKNEFPARTDRRWLEPIGDGDDPKTTDSPHKHHILKYKYQELSCFYRARIDIRHLEAPKLPFVAGRPVCAVAKHLCGVATDLTIAVILRQLQANQQHHQFAGAAIVTCCHTLMKWSDYPEAGKRWLAKHCDAGREQFEIMKQCSGWAVDGGAAAANSHRYSKRVEAREQRLRELRARAAEETTTGTLGSATFELKAEEDRIQASISAHAWRSELPEEERMAIGQSCKRLLDAGRREAFREAGLRCEIVRFVGAEVTPENTLLLAWSDSAVRLQLVV